MDNLDNELSFEDRETQIILNDVIIDEDEELTNHLSFNSPITDEFEQNENELSEDFSSLEEQDSNLTFDSTVLEDENIDLNQNEISLEEEAITLDQEVQSELHFEEETDTMDEPLLEDDETKMTLEEMIQETLQREGLIAPGEKFSLDDVEPVDIDYDLLLQQQNSFNFGGDNQSESDLLDDDDDDDEEVKASNLLFADEEKSANNKLSDSLLDFDSNDFELSFDGEKSLEDTEDADNASYSLLMNDKNEEDDINDDYASSFGSFFDDIGVEKNSEQELIDKVLKDIQAADSGAGYDELGMEFSKKDSVFEKKQTKYLTGKRVTKDIRNEHGEIIAKAGDVIDEKIIKNAKRQGKLIELIMNSN